MPEYKLEELFEKISKLAEEIPASINEQSEVLGTDPQVLQLSLPLDKKEKSYLFSEKEEAPAFQRKPKGPFTKKEPKIHAQHYVEEHAVCTEGSERVEEVEEWDIKVEGSGYFDAKGNYIMEHDQEPEPEQEPKQAEELSSNEEDWITVQDAKGRKKNPNKGKSQSASETSAERPVKTKLAVHAPSTASSSRRSTAHDESETDSEGFTVVKERKPKAATRTRK